MRILFTNFILRGNSGTEMYLRDLALRLKRLGHGIMITSPHPGPQAEELAAAGLEFSADPAGFSVPPDIIHGHHNVTLVAALAAWPGVPALFLCHDATAWHDEAPRHPRIVRYGAVDAVSARRVADDLGCPTETVFIRGNSVDLDRFKSRAPLPARPLRAVVFNHYAARHNFLPAVESACRSAGITLDVIGQAAGTAVDRPEEILGSYDLVFAEARCAMEAAAAGCAVILCGMPGCGPLVTPESLSALRDNNFGRDCLNKPHAVEHLAAEIARWNPEASMQASALVRQHLGLDASAEAWTALYHEILAAPCPVDVSAEMQATSAFLTKLSNPLYRLYSLEGDRAWLTNEVTSLREAAARREAKYAEARANTARLEAQAEETWRLEGWAASRPAAALLRRLGAKPAAPPAKYLPVPFVVGVPRSGTTLLRLMMDSHPDLAIPDETGFIHPLMAAEAAGRTPADAREFLSIITAYPPEAPNWPECGIPDELMLEQLGRMRNFTIGKALRAVGRLSAKLQGKSRWGDKTPDYTQCMEHIWHLLPEVRFIHIVRDVRDVITSWRTMKFAPSSDVRRLAREWRDRIETVRRSARRVPFTLEIRYENLIRRPQAVLEQICRFIRLPFDPLMLRHHERAAARLAGLDKNAPADQAVAAAAVHRPAQTKSVRPPDASNIGLWRDNFTPEELSIIAEEAGPLLAEFDGGRDD